MRQPHQIRTLQAPLVARRNRLSDAAIAGAWCTLGFVSGALFWHLIGFWSFVGQVVLKGPIEERTAREETQRLPASQRATGSISASRVIIAGRSAVGAKAYLNCSNATPEVDQGETSVGPCAPGTPPAPNKPLAKKGDLLTVLPIAASVVATVPWSATVNGSAR